MIEIKKSINTDTRTAKDNIVKKELKNDTILHIKDVKNGCKFIADQLIKSGENHDYTKLALIDKFYEDFSTRAKGDEFKKLGWWKQHMKERHHLNDSVPEDVNLIDVIEMIVDCCMAGMARSGTVYDVKIDSGILQRAVENTKILLLKNIEIKE